MWFEKSAAQGFPLAHHRLGMKYAAGQGVVKSTMEAERCFKRAFHVGTPVRIHGLTKNIAVNGATGEVVDVKIPLGAGRVAVCVQGAGTTSVRWDNLEPVYDHNGFLSPKVF